MPIAGEVGVIEITVTPLAPRNVELGMDGVTKPRLAHLLIRVAADIRPLLSLVATVHTDQCQCWILVPHPLVNTRIREIVTLPEWVIRPARESPLLYGDHLGDIAVPIVPVVVR